MTQKPNPNFSDDQTVVDDYRPFSFLSVFLFLAALIAALIAIVNAKLAVLPVLFMVLSIAMLIRLHSAKNYLPQSYLFAAAALAVSLIGFSFQMYYQTVRYRHLQATAIHHCETWLDLVKTGRVLDAHEMSLDKKDRQPPGTDLTTIYGRVDDPSSDLSSYLDMQPEKAIRAIGPDAKLTIERIAYFRPHNRHDRFEILYRLKRNEFEKDDYLFAILMQRTRPVGPENVFWEMRKLVNVRPAFARSFRKIGVLKGEERELID